jgi:hypothetical protein
MIIIGGGKYKPYIVIDLRPILSAKGPQNIPPQNSPRNTILDIEAISVCVSDQSLPAHVAIKFSILISCMMVLISNEIQ